MGEGQGCVWYLLVRYLSKCIYLSAVARICAAALHRLAALGEGSVGGV
jgi:hypothetical protein